MGTALRQDATPSAPGGAQSTHTQISYSYTLGHTWVECGISKVNNLLSALGFRTTGEVTAFCAEVNVFEVFAEASWIRTHTSDADKRLLSGEPRRGALTFLPNVSATPTLALNTTARRPSYDDFFGLLFTWLTHGHRVEDRRQFVAWWSYENGVSIDPRLASVGNTTPRNPQKTVQTRSPVLTTFKEAVDGFLARRQQSSAAGGFLPMNFAPPSGAIPYAVGQASVVRIPVPNTNGLCIEFRPRGHVPASGSTSTLFFQDITGRRHLRLDYGYNVRTQTVDYHWNQKGTNATFGIADHTTVGRNGRAAYNAAKYFRYGGRVLVVVGVTLDAISIAQASKPLKRASEVVAGWAGAWAGCKVIGAGCAIAGSFASPLGTAAGGVGGCIIGGIGGYYAGSTIGGYVYDWAEGTFFTPLPEIRQP